MNVSTIVFLTTLTIVITNIVFGNKLKYNANSGLIPSVNENVVKVSPLFDSSVYLCLISKNDEILDVFLDYFKNKNNTISLLEFGQNYDSCDTIVFFDFNMTGCKSIVVERDKSLYFLNHQLELQLKTIETCSVKSLPYEIVSICLTRGFLYRLQREKSSCCSFKRSSVGEILSYRLKANKINLRGKVIKVAYDPNPPYIITTDGRYEKTTAQGKNKTDLIDGFELLLFKELASQLNFTTKFIRYEDWGTLSSKGTWENGLIEAVVNGEADLALSAIWMIKTLYNSLDFGPTLNRVNIGFLVRRPEAIEFQWKNLLTIFQSDVWVVILLSFLFVIAVYWIGVNNYFEGRQRPCWTECFLTILGLTIQTGFPRRKMARFVCYILTSWSFFSLLLTTILSGNVFCGLTLPQYSSRIDTIEQLVRGQYYWTVQYYARFYNSPDMKRDIFNLENPWVRKFEEQYKYLTSKEVHEKAYTDKKVTFLTESFGTDLIFLDIGGLEGHEALRDFRMMREEVTSTHISFGIAKNSPLLEPITTMTLKLQEAGLSVQWTNRVLRRWPIYNTRHLLIETDVMTFREPQELALNKLQPVFYLLLFGLIVACLVFALEVIW